MVEDEDIVEVSIEEFKFSLTTAENDFNENKRCLFATMIWSGASVIAKFLSKTDERHRIKGKSILEFGAAAGLPSIVCSHLGAEIVCASDYPSQCVIDNLTKNIAVNCPYPNSQVHVIKHLWGEDVAELLHVNNDCHYDVIIAAECLWHHTSHPLLITSICNTLKPNGTAYISFSHHVPGLEADDLNFFILAEQRGLRVVNKQTIVAPHMWSDRDANIFLYELEYTVV